MRGFHTSFYRPAFITLRNSIFFVIDAIVIIPLSCASFGLPLLLAEQTGEDRATKTVATVNTRPITRPLPSFLSTSPISPHSVSHQCHWFDRVSFRVIPMSEGHFPWLMPSVQGWSSDSAVHCTHCPHPFLQCRTLCDNTRCLLLGQNFIVTIALWRIKRRGQNFICKVSKAPVTTAPLEGECTGVLAAAQMGQREINQGCLHPVFTLSTLTSVHRSKEHPLTINYQSTCLRPENCWFTYPLKEGEE